MYRSGSHRGAPVMKKKMFIRGQKKKAITELERVRNFVLNEIQINEERRRNNQSTCTMFRCRDLSEKLKCDLGEIVKSIEHLNREGLTSKISKRRMTFSIFLSDIEEEEEQDILQIFDFEQCPICKSNLDIKKTRSRKWENGKYIYTHVQFVDSICKNKCFCYKAASLMHQIDIFDKKTIIYNSWHKSIFNSKVKEIKKEIERYKKNERYVMKIMENNI